jgi:purine-nucleoside phosphorylase
MRDRKLEKEAASAAEDIRCFFGFKKSLRIKTAILLGTGWGNAFTVGGFRKMPLTEISGFTHLDRFKQVEGHERLLLYGEFGGEQVLALKGRIHLNESIMDYQLYRMVRLQVEMLFHLGVKNFIITSAVGSLDEGIEVGDVAVVNSLLTLFAPNMPLKGGEFCSPEDVLPSINTQDRIFSLAQEVGLKAIPATHAMVLGPFFESRKVDKVVLKMLGADVVGMSLLPELCISALYKDEEVEEINHITGEKMILGGIKPIGVCFVTNSSSEIHSHETNQERAIAKQVLLTRFLEKIVKNL